MSYQLLMDVQEVKEEALRFENAVNTINFALTNIEFMMEQAVRIHNTDVVSAANAESTYCSINACLTRLRMEEAALFSFESVEGCSDYKLQTENAVIDAVKRVWQAIVDSVNWLIEKISEFLGFTKKKSEKADDTFKEVKEKTQKVIKAAKQAKQPIKWADILITQQSITQHFAYLGKKVELSDICKESEYIEQTMEFLIGFFSALSTTESELAKFVLDFTLKMDGSWGEGGSEAFILAVDDVVYHAVSPHIQRLIKPENMNAVLKQLKAQYNVEPNIVREQDVYMTKGFLDGYVLLFYCIGGDGQFYQQVRKVKLIETDRVDCAIAIDNPNMVERLMQNTERNVKTVDKLAEASDRELKTIREKAKLINRALLQAVNQNKDQAYYEQMRNDFKTVHTMITTVKLLVSNSSAAVGMSLTAISAFTALLDQCNKEIHKALNR